MNASTPARDELYPELVLYTFAIVLLSVAWMMRLNRLERTQRELEKTTKALDQAKKRRPAKGKK